MKPTINDLINSAKFCGYEPENYNGKIFVQARNVVDVDDLVILDGASTNARSMIRWEPPDNPGQRDELLHALLAKGYEVVFRDGQHQLIWNDIYDTIVRFESNCVVNDFLTLAASHVQEQSDDA